MAPPVNGMLLHYQAAMVGDFVSRRFTGSPMTRVIVTANNTVWAYWNSEDNAAVGSELMIIAFSDGTFHYYRTLEPEPDNFYEAPLQWWESL